MATPSRRLDLVLVPCPSSRSPDPEPLWEVLVAHAVIDEGGRPGPEARAWCAGGFARIYLDRPGRLTFWANQGGGFRVHCPACRQNLIPAFQPALTAWRAGGPETLQCGGCERVFSLSSLDYRPPAAFGQIALVTADVGEAALTPAGLAWVEAAWGEVKTVLRRG